MWNEDDRKWLYEKMRRAGVNTGSYDDFKNSLNDEKDRKWYYDKSRSLGLNVGSPADFDGMMVEPVKPGNAGNGAAGSRSSRNSRSRSSRSRRDGNPPGSSAWACRCNLTTWAR